MPYIDGTGKNYSQKKQRVDQWRTQRSTSFTCTCILTYCKYCSPLPLYVNESSVLSRMFCFQAPFRHPIQNCSSIVKGSSKITRSEIPRLSHITKQSRMASYWATPVRMHVESDLGSAAGGIFFVVVTLMLSSCFSGSRHFMI